MAVTYRNILALLMLCLASQLGTVHIQTTAGGPTGMKSLQFSSSTDNFNLGAATNYVSVLGESEDYSTTLADHEQIAPVAGDYSRLRVTLQADIGPANDNLAAQLFVAGVACSPALSCVITGGAGTEVTCDSLDSDSCSVTAGQLVALEWVTEGTPANTHAGWSIQFQATSGNESAQMAIAFGLPANNGPDYFPLSGTGPDDGSRPQRETAAPLEGDLSDFRCIISAVPGGTATRKFEILVGGSSTVPDLVSECTAAQTDCGTDTSSAPYTKGALYVIAADGTNTPDISDVKCSVKITSDDGDFAVLSVTDGNSSETVTQYGGPASTDFPWNSTEAARSAPAATAFTANDFYSNVETASGTGGQSRLVSLVVAGSTTGLACTLTDADILCSDTDQTESVADAALISIEQNPGGTAPDSTTGFGFSFSGTIP